MSEYVTVEMSIKKDILERFRAKQIEDARQRLTISTQHNLAEGIAIHNRHIEFYEKADYQELARWLLMDAEDKYQSE